MRTKHGGSRTQNLGFRKNSKTTSKTPSFSLQLSRSSPCSTTGYFNWGSNRAAQSCERKVRRSVHAPARRPRRKKKRVRLLERTKVKKMSKNLNKERLERERNQGGSLSTGTRSESRWTRCRRRPRAWLPGRVDRARMRSPIDMFCAQGTSPTFSYTQCCPL